MPFEADVEESDVSAKATRTPIALLPCAHVVCASCDALFCAASDVAGGVGAAGAGAGAGMLVRLKSAKSCAKCCVRGCGSALTTKVHDEALEDFLLARAQVSATAMEGGAGSGTPVFCADCLATVDDEVVSTHVCVGCKGGNKPLCPTHATVHTLRSHVVALLGGSPPEAGLCAAHPTNPTSYHDTDRNLLVCHECTMPGQAHARDPRAGGHATSILAVGVSVAALSARTAPVAAACVAGAASNLAEAQAIAEAILALECNVSEGVTLYVQRVDDAIAQLTRTIHARRNSVLEEVQQKQVMSTKALEATESVHRVDASQLLSGVAVCTAARERGNPVTMKTALASLERVAGLCRPRKFAEYPQCEIQFDVGRALALVPACTLVKWAPVVVQTEARALVLKEGQMRAAKAAAALEAAEITRIRQHQGMFQGGAWSCCQAREHVGVCFKVKGGHMHNYISGHPYQAAFWQCCRIPTQDCKCGSRV